MTSHVIGHVLRAREVTRSAFASSGEPGSSQYPLFRVRYAVAINCASGGRSEGEDDGYGIPALVSVHVSCQRKGSRSFLNRGNLSI